LRGRIHLTNHSKETEMKTSTQLILSAAAACFSIGVHAAMPVNAADLPRISNGGTGFIGLTDSAGTQRQAYMHSRTTTSSVPNQAGEASTMVNGVPNQTVATDGSVMAARPDLRTIGQSGTAAAAANPSWGTPK